ncbi:2-amino-5-chloromuconate deaminase CnbZ [Nonomuraea sp. NPDC001699]
MMDAAGVGSGYRYLPGVGQYSAGVVADPGHGIVRVRFPVPVPLRAAFGAAEKIIGVAGRPLTALCSWELRSPRPFTESSFTTFNAEYIALLDAWGVIGPDGANPVARSNVCPAADPVPEPSAHAFAFTVPADTDIVQYVVSGSAESPEGLGDYRDHMVAYRDVSAGGLLAKVRFVTSAMKSRMEGLGVSGHPPRVVQIYTVHDVQSVLRDEVMGPLRCTDGLTWHPHRPPVLDLEYEMDCRTVGAEYLAGSGGIAR